MQLLLICFLLFCNLINTFFSFRCDDGSAVYFENPVCNGIDECMDCSDEKNCSFANESDMVSCNGESDTFTRCVRKEKLCDGKQDCENCFDERNCPNSKLFFCNNGKGCVDFSMNEPRCADPERGACARFCNGFFDCNDGSDEETLGFGFKCASEKDSYRCLIPQVYLERYINDTEVLICENNVNQCFQVINGTKFFNSSKCWSCLEGSIIQRQQVCDGIFDCPDLSDECLCDRDAFDNICKGLFSNQNCLSNQVSCPDDGTCLNVSQICDGTRNCKDGYDEANCTLKCEVASDFQCNLTHLHDHLQESSRKLPARCDGKPDCETAEDECNAGCADIPGYCQYIRTSLKSEFLSCGNDTADFTTTFQLCDKLKDCNNGFDEQFCPNLARCPSTNGSTVTYDIRQCGPDRCNLQATCANIADELNCSQTTHFYCDGNKTFLPQWHRFDGKYDCDDFSDECSFKDTSVSSSKDVVKFLSLRVFLWILMFLSLTGNAAVLVKTLFELHYALRRRSHSSVNRVGVCNKIMIVHLAFSDFLMGVYLFLIVIKTIQFSGNYCTKQIEWLQSAECTFLGVLAVISSQSSILLIVLMTSYRLYGVTNPFRAEKISGRMICCASFTIWTVAILLAVVPLFPSLRQSFSSKILIHQPYKSDNLLSLTDLENFFKTANRLPGLRNSFPTPSSLTLETFCTLFKYSRSKPSFCGLEQRSLSNTTGYYGWDGVCLPRYYGNQQDPVSGYTLGVISLNFVAFMYMLVAYFYIYRSTSIDLQQGDSDCGSMDDMRLKENRALWSKIVRLVVTDFICWVPICIMSFMSFNGVVLPDIVYPVTAIILVPINSAANPWLYSSFLADYFKSQWDSNQLKRFCFGKKRSNPAESAASYTKSKKSDSQRRRRRKRRRSNERSLSITITSRVSVTGAITTDNSVMVSTNL